MATRTVTGTILHNDDTAWASAEVKFSLLTPFSDAAGVHPSDDHTETTDASGNFSIALAVPDTGTAEYEVMLPDHKPARFNVGAGAATTLQSLLTIPIAPVDVNALQLLIDAYAVQANWASWTPTLSGFSAAPTGGIYRYCKPSPNVVIARVYMPNAGTSNANTFTLTAPVAAGGSGEYNATMSFAIDNGSQVASPGVASLYAASSTITLWKDKAGGGWTASGDKRAGFTLIYEIA